MIGLGMNMLECMELTAHVHELRVKNVFLLTHRYKEKYILYQKG